MIGELEQELEHLSIEDIYKLDGIDVIMGLLKKPFEQRLIYQKRRFLHAFRRFQGESMRTCVQTFRRVQRSLKAVGVDISGTFGSDSLGSRLLDRSGQDQRMVLVGTQQSLEFETIAECLILQWPEFRTAPPVVNEDGHSKGKGKHATTSSSSTSLSTLSSASTKGSSKGTMPRKQTYLTEVVADENEEPPEEFEDAQEQLDDDPADGGEELADPADEDDGQEAYDDDVTQDLASLAQVLTVTARKLSGVTLGRKFSTGNKSKKSPEELRKVTHCRAQVACQEWSFCGLHFRFLSRTCSTTTSSA